MIPIDSNPEPLFRNRFREEIDLAADEFAKPRFQCTEFEQPDVSLRIELGEQIDVAIHAGLAAGHGTEQGETPNSCAAKVRLVGAQGLDDPFRRWRGAHGSPS